MDHCDGRLGNMEFLDYFMELKQLKKKKNITNSCSVFENFRILY